MIDGAARIGKMIEGILAYSRAGLAELDAVEIDLGDQWRIVCGDLELQIAEAGATVAVGGLPCIYGDTVRLRQVFQNLLSNALKYRSPDRPLLVSVEAAIRSPGDAC